MERKEKVTFAGYSLEDLYDCSVSTLQNLAELIEIENGTEIAFKGFSKLTKDEAITLIVNGDNSVTESKEIVERKKAELKESGGNVEGVKAYQAEQKAKREAIQERKFSLLIESGKVRFNSEKNLFEGLSNVRSSEKSRLIRFYRENYTPNGEPKSKGKAKSKK